MTRRNRLLKTLSVILPSGALGASVLLALTSPASAMSAQTPAADAPPARTESVAARLQAIRAGVSVIAATDVSQATEGAGVVPIGADPAGDPKATPTWWGNGGFGRWRLGWGNGGGWRNGGWGNGWHNGGWGNGWHNGGWRNFWHNW
jgi:hypothetical protein